MTTRLPHRSPGCCNSRLVCVRPRRRAGRWRKGTPRVTRPCCMSKRAACHSPMFAGLLCTVDRRLRLRAVQERQGPDWFSDERSLARTLDVGSL
jgi:hypothetical protein